MTWGSLIMIALGRVKWLVEYGQKQKWIGEDEAIQITKALTDILHSLELSDK